MDEWINRMWNIHIMKYYSALKTKDILHDVPTWMNLENITRREISQSQKRQIRYDSAYKSCQEKSNS